MTIKCPKCHHTRTTQDDPLIPDYQCPACGVVYAKVSKQKPLHQPPGHIKPAVFEADETPRNYFSVKKIQSIKAKYIDRKIIIFAIIMVSSASLFLWALDNYHQTTDAERAAIEKRTAQMRASEEKRIQNDLLAKQGFDFEADNRAKIEQDSKQRAIKEQEKKQECLNDAKCSFNRLQDSAYQCVKSIEKLSKWSFKWKDGFFENKLDRFSWADSTHTTIYAAGDHIQFQNGFGAFADMQYICEVDAKTGLIKNATVVQGRF